MDAEGKSEERKTKEGRDGIALSVPAEEHRAITAAAPEVPLHGIPGFHNKVEEGDQVRLAAMELDADRPAFAHTGTGEQPGNSGGSRFATHSGDEE
jgi:hypothetical protein